MEIVNQTLAKSLWHFSFEEMNPRGLDLMPILAAIKNHYKFTDHKGRDSGQGPLHRFSNGVFALNDNSRIEVSYLDFFPDGVSVDTKYNTAASDAVIEDVLELVSRKHGLFYEPAMINKKGYLSEFVVKSDVNLMDLNPGLHHFCSEVSAATNLPLEFAPTQLTLGVEQSALTFSFARRSGVAFDQNRYFSSAPVSTDVHLRLVNAFEAMLKK